MHQNTPKLLEDIRDAASFIADNTQSISEAVYKQNRMLRQSVERNFEIIGEAMRRLTQYDPDVASISGYRQIIAFRNILIHGYDTLNHDVVWHVIQRELPVLLMQVTTLLTQQDSSQ